MNASALSRRAALLGFCALISGCMTVLDPGPPPDLGNLRSAAALPQVNALRKTKGLPPLVVDAAAGKAALYQANRMAREARMAHLMGPLDDFGTRVKASGVVLPAAENIATGQDSTEEAVTAWINSRHHLENMLGPYRKLGVAVAYDSRHDNRPYWAMILSN